MGNFTNSYKSNKKKNLIKAKNYKNENVQPLPKFKV